MKTLKWTVQKNKFKQLILSSIICFSFVNYSFANDANVEEDVDPKSSFSSAPADQSNSEQLPIVEILRGALPLLLEIDKSLLTTSHILSASKEDFKKVNISLDHLTQDLSQLSEGIKLFEGVMG